MKTAKARRIPAIILVVTLALTLPLMLGADVSTDPELETALTTGLKTNDYNYIYVVDGADVTYDTADINLNGTTIVDIEVDGGLTLGDINVSDNAEFYAWYGYGDNILMISADNLFADDNGFIQFSGKVNGDVVSEGGYIIVSNDIDGTAKVSNGGTIRTYGKLPSMIIINGVTFTSPTRTNLRMDRYDSYNEYTDGDSYFLYCWWDPLLSSGKSSSKTKPLPAAQSGGTWKLNEDGTWSYLNPDGKKATGWVESEDGKWFLLAPDGTMVTGWVIIDGVWYYLGADGVMAAGSRVRIDGKTYIFDANGKCTNP